MPRPIVPHLPPPPRPAPPQDLLEHQEACERLQEGESPPSPTPSAPKWVPLAADDFLPIFIFVVVQCCTQAAMPAPMRTRDLLWALADDTHLQVTKHNNKIKPFYRPEQNATRGARLSLLRAAGDI